MKIIILFGLIISLFCGGCKKEEIQDREVFLPQRIVEIPTKEKIYKYQEEVVIIGILFEALKDTNREEFILDFLDSIEIVGGEATEPFCIIENPCGEKYIIQNKKDFPLDKDIPCTCGNKNHFFIKYEELK